MRKLLKDESIFNKTSQKATIVEMIRWCGSFIHFSGSPSTLEFENHWQYRGYVPVSRVAEGTICQPSPSHPVTETEAKRWTAGCFGTTGVMSHLLRLVNIPVETTIVCGHTLPNFSSINCWLSHGDDPYGLKFHPEVDPEKLLVDQATFDQWFGSSALNPCDNVGRRGSELFQ